MILTAVIHKSENGFEGLIPQRGTCPGKAFFKAGDSLFAFDNPDQIEIHEGDVAEMELSPAKSILTSFIFFILPLILTAAAYLSASALTESAIILWSSSGAAFAFSMIAARFFSRLTAGRFRPRLIRILKDFRPSDCSGCSGCSLN